MSVTSSISFSCPRNQGSQGGSVMLEALIAIVIFSMGILAIVGLQTVSMKAASDAKYRIDASFLANQVLADMWVDRNNLANYVWNGTGAAPAAIANWSAQVQSTLPGADINPPSITVDGGNVVTVTVRWQAPRESVHQLVTVADVQG